ncbi:hypothetical protein MTR_4g024820 [Medicago truncatula]|uniref:Uncharacterized protein n=1 Tax=Medicago truncatula TaxID=3880 RepID=G7JFT2_MEDTR|nr:hypothetical protein MTR_4g024820 [Medicago truncatula]
MATLDQSSIQSSFGVFVKFHCTSFPIVPRSLSRKNQCGIEVKHIYFYLGCFIVQHNS